MSELEKRVRLAIENLSDENKNFLRELMNGKYVDLCGLPIEIQKIFREFRTGASIDIKTLSDEIRKLAFCAWGESPAGRRFMEACYDNEVITYGWNIGRSCYFDLIPSESNLSNLSKLLERALKIDNSNISLDGVTHNDFIINELPDKHTLSIGINEEFEDKCEKKIDYLASAFTSNQDINDTAFYESIFQLYNLLQEVNPQYSVRIVHNENENYEIAINYSKDRLDKKGDVITKYDYDKIIYSWVNHYIVEAHSFEDLKSKFLALTNFLKENLKAYELDYENDHMTYKELCDQKREPSLYIYQKKKKMLQTPGGQEKFKKWLEKFKKGMKDYYDKQEEKTRKELLGRDIVEYNNLDYKMMIVRKDSISYILAYPKDSSKMKNQMIVQPIDTMIPYGYQVSSSVFQVKRTMDLIDDAPIVIPLSIHEECKKTNDSKTFFSMESKLILGAINDAKELLNSLEPNLNVASKVMLKGHGPTSIICAKFALVHPELVDKCLIGGVAGGFPLPTKQVAYPLGIKNFEDIFEKPFNEEEFKKIKFAIWGGDREAIGFGEYDTNGKGIIFDSRRRIIDKSVTPAPGVDVTYNPQYVDSIIGKKYREAFGKDINDRFVNVIRFLKSFGNNVKVKIYADKRYEDIDEYNENQSDDFLNFYYFGEGFDKTEKTKFDERKNERKEIE